MYICTGGFSLALCFTLQHKSTVMAAKKDKEKLLAKELYLATDKSLKDISAIVAVSQNHVGRWAREGGWDNLKSARTVTKQQMIANYYKLLKDMHDNIAARPTPTNVPTIQEVNIMSQLTNQLAKFEKKGGLSEVVYIIEQFLQWMLKVDAVRASSIAPFAYEFCETKAREIADNDGD